LLQKSDNPNDQFISSQEALNSSIQKGIQFLRTMNNLLEALSVEDEADDPDDIEAVNHIRQRFQ